MTGRARNQLSFLDVGDAYLGVLAHMHREAFPEDPWDEASIAGILSMPGAFGRIAVDSAASGLPIGFTIGLVIVPECELLSIGVLPTGRRKGIAAALMKDFMSNCSAARARAIFLEVAVDNVPALNLYRQFGFQQVGLRSNYYSRADGNRVDALQLRSEA